MSLKKCVYWLRGCPGGSHKKLLCQSDISDIYESTMDEDDGDGYDDGYLMVIMMVRMMVMVMMVMMHLIVMVVMMMLVMMMVVMTMNIYENILNI